MNVRYKNDDLDRLWDREGCVSSPYLFIRIYSPLNKTIMKTTTSKRRTRIAYVSKPIYSTSKMMKTDPAPYDGPEDRNIVQEDYVALMEDNMSI